MKLKKFLPLLILILLSVIGDLSAQITTSVYSRFGIGEPMYNNSSRYRSMGGIGIGALGIQSVNTANPATFSDLKLTTLDFGMDAGYRFQNSGDLKDSRFQAGINQFAFGFPSNKSFAFAMGFSPYSGVGYNIIQSDSVLINDTYESYQVTYNGDGSVNKFFLGASGVLFKKLKIGASLNLLFGNTNYSTSSAFENTDYSPINHSYNLSIRGVVPQLGVQYQDTLKIKVKVDELKNVQRQITLLNTDKAKLEKETKQMNKESRKLEAGKASLAEKKEVIDEDRNYYTQKVAYLKSVGKGSEEEIARTERKSQLLLQKKKKLQIGYQSKVRKIQDMERSLNNRSNRINDIIGAKKEEVKTLEADSSKRFVKKSKSILFNVGLVYEPGVKVKAEDIRMIDNFLIVDTLGDFREGKLTLPQNLGFGFSISDGSKFMVGMDVRYTGWAKMDILGEGSQMRNALDFHIGGEWTPRPYSRKYHERISWRAGAFMKTGFYDYSQFSFAQNGVTFGAGLPLRRPEFFSKMFSRLNVGFEYNFRGSSLDGLIRENLVLMTLGVNLKDRWFIKTKID